MLETFLDLWRWNLSIATCSTIVGVLVCINIYMHWSTQRLPINQSTNPPSEHTVCEADGEECQHYSRSQHGVALPKDPPLLSFTGPTKQIHETDSCFIRLLLSNKAQEVSQMAQRIIKSD